VRKKKQRVTLAPCLFWGEGGGEEEKGEKVNRGWEKEKMKKQRRRGRKGGKK
jgi:hypothetical protein